MALKFASSEAIRHLVGRFEVGMIYEQALLESAVLDKGVIKILKRPGKIGQVNIKSGAFSSTKWLEDNDSLPTAASVDPVALFYYPKVLFSFGTIGRLAMDNVSGVDEAANLIAEEMSSMAADVGQQLGMSLFRSAGQHGSPAASVTANSSTSFTIADASGIVVGQTLDVYSDSPAFVESVVVTGVTRAAPGSNDTVSFTGGGSGGAAANNWTTAYTIHSAGSYSDGILGLPDVTAAASLYGQAQTSNEWSGELSSGVGSLSISDLQDMSTKLKKRRKKSWSHIISNSVGEQRYNALINDQRRFMGMSMDGVGTSLTFEGKPWVVDENCLDGDIYFHSDDTVKLHEFLPFQVNKDGGSGGKLGKAAVVVSQSTYSYTFQGSGAYQLRVQERRGTGRLAGVTD